MRRSLHLASLLLVACSTASPEPPSPAPSPTPAPLTEPAPAPAPAPEPARPTVPVEQTLAELEGYAQAATRCGELDPPRFDADAMVAVQLAEADEQRVALRRSMEAIIAARLACRGDE